MNTVLGHEDQPELSVKVFGSKISLYEEQGGNDCYITSEHLDSDIRPFFSPCSPSFLGSAAIRPPTSMLLQSALGLAYIRPLIDLQPAMFEQSTPVPTLQPPSPMQVILCTLVEAGSCLQSRKPEKTFQRPKTPKLVAEWADRSGTRFLLRKRVEIANEEACRIQEHYETEEVTPDVVEGLGVLDPWRGFQETRPEEWKLHNQLVHSN